MPKDDGYAPVVFNPQDYAAKRSQEDVAFADAYSDLQENFAALVVQLQAHHSSRADVAECKGVKF